MRIRGAQKEKMRKPVSRYVIGKLPRAFEQQIILNTANVFAAAEGTDTACAGIDLTSGRGLSCCVQDAGPQGERRNANWHPSRAKHSPTRSTHTIIPSRVQHPP